MRKYDALIGLFLSFSASAHGTAEYNCDEDAITDDARASSLLHNQFYKICPKITNGAFGQPQCGDGTPFSFLFTRPPKRKNNNKKILIEFQGGGACWDEDTCDKMSGYLTFPTFYNDFVGMGCSEIKYGTENANRFPIEVLCSKQVGDVDFTEYNTIVVPYCSQDVYTGNSITDYEDGSIAHVGAHNVFSVLRWVFQNFKDPAHIALTGCSAGGTALPMVYDLLNKHYNNLIAGGRSVQISVIADSPVYLTPEYFLHNGFQTWQPRQYMKRIGFNFDKHQYDTDYPTIVWDHILRRGSNADRWGFVTHTYDEESIMFYQYMSGNGDNDDDDDDDESSQWWNLLNASLTTIQSKHRNVDTYIEDGDGHCSFGLYYGFLEEGFDEWAGSIFQEQKVRGNSGVRAGLLYMSALCLGGFVVAGVFYAKKSQTRACNVDDSSLLSGEVEMQPYWKSVITSKMLQLASCPITASYFVATAFYFFTMLVSSGFAHPIDNPSLGPTAYDLSSFGINNPTLIVYERQFVRLLTSNFLCSGVITYLMFMFCIVKYTWKIETQVNNHALFALAMITTMIGSNLCYATFLDGASCASLSTVLGLNAFSIYESYRAADTVDFRETEWYMEQSNGFPRPWKATIIFFLFTCILFPFNNWLILLSAIIIGSAVLPFMVDWQIVDSNNSTEEVAQEKGSEETTQRIRKIPCSIVGSLYFVILLLMLIKVRKPNEIYKAPYTTGCQLMYTTDVGVILNFSGNVNENSGANDRMRRLGDGDLDYDSMCAQICVPHIGARPLLGFVNDRLPFSIDTGICEENGYPEFIIEKTFNAASYSLDVDVYYQYSSDDDEDRRG